MSYLVIIGPNSYEKFTKSVISVNIYLSKITIK